MTKPKTELSLRIRAFSADISDRKQARLDVINDFWNRAKNRDRNYKIEQLIHGRLFAYELDDEKFSDFFAFANDILDDEDQRWWQKYMLLCSLREGAFDKASLILEKATHELCIEVSDFNVITPELLTFLTEKKGSVVLKPFTQMSWGNEAGSEGFMALLRLVDPEILKAHILDEHFDPKKLSFSSLAVFCEAGLLDDIFDRVTNNLVIAKGFIEYLSEHPHEDSIRDTLDRYSSDRLLEIFATFAEFGEAKHVSFVMKALVPFLVKTAEPKLHDA